MALLAGLFGAILIIVGILGFIIPPDKAKTSGTGPYNLFHICFGIVGIAAALAGSTAAGVFLIGFGLIDLYQFVASRKKWFPQRQFRWTIHDDRLHLVIGAALVVAGVIGFAA